MIHRWITLDSAIVAKRKNQAAVALGKLRFAGMSAEERSAFGSLAVQARETQRQARRQQMRDLVMKAAIPSYLKAQLLSASSGQGDMKSYSEVGYQLGRYHLDDFSEDPDLVFMVSEGEVMSHPSRILRRIFSSNDHPRGELTDLIPLNQRRDFLIGLLAGASDEEPEDFWLSRLERE